MLLAGDVGGTNTRLAVFSPDRGPREPIAEATYASREHEGIAAIVTDFLARAEIDVGAACFGVAGPVVGGRSEFTNLPWVVDTALLREALALETVELVNDLEALAAAVPKLRPEDMQTISAGRTRPRGSIAVIAPGTGLGEAFLVWDGDGYRAHASEGGHTDFGPRNQGEIGLLRYLQARFSRVSYERVCSGSGLPYIYDYLRESGYVEPDWLAAALGDLGGPADPADPAGAAGLAGVVGTAAAAGLAGAAGMAGAADLAGTAALAGAVGTAAAGDRTSVIVSAALDDARPCTLCQATLRTFASVLGAEAGNLALSALSTGGVYLGGGIPRRILPFLTDGQFLRSMHDKGRQTGLVANIPVHVITYPRAALLGVAILGMRAAGMRE